MNRTEIKMNNKLWTKAGEMKWLKTWFQKWLAKKEANVPKYLGRK